MSDPKKQPVYEFYIVLALDERIEDYAKSGWIRLAQSTDHCYRNSFYQTKQAQVAIYSTTQQDPPAKVNERLMVQLRSYHEPNKPHKCYFKIPYAMKDVAKQYKYRWDPEKKQWWSMAKAAPLFLAQLIADESYRRHILRPALAMHHEFRSQPARYLEPRAQGSTDKAVACLPVAAMAPPDEWLD